MTGKALLRTGRTGLMAVLLSALLFTACEDDDYDHDPPEGQGSLIIDNRTFNDIYVYLNGDEQVRAPYDGERTYDLDPGVYRLVLDERGGDRFYSEDIDILEDRLTVLKVFTGITLEYDVDLLLR